MSTDNRTLLNGCESAADSWAGDDSVTDNTLGGLYYQGSQGLSTQLSNALERMTCSTIGGTRDLSDSSVWFLVKDNLADTKAQGGHQIVLSDGTDEIGFYCNGNDDPPLQLSTYFLCLKLDVSNRSALSANAYAGVTANLTDTAITGVGYGSIHTAKAQGAIDNVFLDAFRFLSNNSYALTINAGTSGTPETWADVAGDDITNGWGMVANLQGSKYDINASWEWGDTANGNSYFSDSDFQLYVDARDMGTGNFIVRTIAGTGTNELTLSDAVIVNLGTPAVWDLSDTDMNVTKFTSVTWTDAGTIKFSTQSAGNRFVNNCIFNNCAQVDFQSIDADGCTFNGTTDANGAIIWDADDGSEENQDNITFVSDGTGHAIYININTASATTFNISGYLFDGFARQDGTAGNRVFYINNPADGAITINLTDCSAINPSSGSTGSLFSYELAAGTTSTVSIVSTVTVKVAGVSRGTPVKIIARETLGSVTDGDTLFTGFADANGEVTYSHNDEGSLDVLVVARNQGVAVTCVHTDVSPVTYTFETAEGSSNTTGDMNLMKSPAAAGDYYAFGHHETFTRLKLDISTALAYSAGSPNFVWEYYSSTGWAALSGVSDGTNNLENTGANIVSWTNPSNWQLVSVPGDPAGTNLYFVRIRFATLPTITTLPLGRKVQLDTTRYLPYSAERIITSGTGLTDNASWQEDTISNFTQ